MIEWAGVRSDDLGIVVEHYPKPIIPEKKQTIQSVDGRTGDIIISTNSFKNYSQPYSVFLDSKNKGGLPVVFPKLVEWLMGNNGYQRLEDSYFPDVYRMAYYSGGTDFLSSFNEYGRGTLTFNCDPRKFYKDGDVEISISNDAMAQGYTLYNPSPFAASPLIKFTTTVHGSGGYANLSFGSNNTVQIDLTTQTQDGLEVSIDVEKRVAYLNGNKIDFVDPESISSFFVANKWYEFLINGLNINNPPSEWNPDYNTYIPYSAIDQKWRAQARTITNDSGVTITIPAASYPQEVEGHLIEYIIDPSSTHETVSYELVDGRLVLTAQNYSWAVYGSYDDLMLRGASAISLSGGTNLRITPRWWTI